MAGSDQSKNLSGMFQMINAPISEMGKAGNQYVETFRRSMAPKGGHGRFSQPAELCRLGKA